MAKHARILADAGVDFIMVDWSNDIGCNIQNNYICNGVKRLDIEGLEVNTKILMQEFAKVPGAPKVAIIVGSSDPSVYHQWDKMRTKLDSIVGFLLQDESISHMYFHMDGKPFVIDYVGTPSPFQNGLPPWNDNRFTVRHMTGFVSDQANLRDGDHSKYGYWSWEDRSIQTKSDAMTVGAAWRGIPSWNSGDRKGRENGNTLRQRW